jgi:pyruvate, water dikinase
VSATPPTCVVPFRGELPSSAATLGGKAAGLVDMARQGLPVPDGFALSAEAFRQFVRSAGAEPELASLIRGLAPDDLASAEAIGAQMRAVVERAELPDDLERAIATAYAALGEPVGEPEPLVAVRSSATAEDSETASFAGEYESFLGIRGTEQVFEYVRRCWASLYTSRGLSYAASRDLAPLDIAMGVVVELLVPATRSGVAFTLDPARGDRMKIVIEASVGLGLSVVGGEVTPDRFVVDKLSLETVERTRGSKEIKYELASDGTVQVHETSSDEREAYCLSDQEVRKLAELAKRVERTYRAPQDIEWAIAGDDGDVLLLQRRPVTAWTGQAAGPAYDPNESVLGWVTASLMKGVSAR